MTKQTISPGHDNGKSDNKTNWLLIVSLLILTFNCLSLSAADSKTHYIEDSIKLNPQTGVEVPIYKYQKKEPEKNNKLIIWLPSGFGLRPTELKPVARQLHAAGFDIWLADLHAGYFAPKGRTGIQKFKSEEIVNLLRQAEAQQKTAVYLIASGNGARTALKLARYWQLNNKPQQLLRGLILLSPVLYDFRPMPGKDAQYIREVFESNLSMQLIQPEYSSLSLHSRSLVKALANGGSQVFFQYLPGIKDGFYARPDTDLSQNDKLAKTKLSRWISQAIRNIESVPFSKYPAARIKPTTLSIAAKPGLQKLQSVKLPPTLNAYDLDNKLIKLEDYRGKVVLISFWASWCPPCVKELPSLNRLQNQLGNKGLKIITVNFGEKKPIIRKFLKTHSIQAKVLLDTELEISKTWKVYVVPSNYLLDKRGRLRFGSVGAVNWDDPEIRKKVRSLLRKK